MTDNSYTRRFLKDPPKTEEKDGQIEGPVQFYEDKFGNELREVDKSVEEKEEG